MLLNKKSKFLVLTLILSLSLTLAGCQESGSKLTATGSNLTDQNLSQVPHSLNKITVKFNNQVAEAEVVAEENGKQLEKIKTEVADNQVTVSNLNLKPLNSYNLTLKAADEKGNQITDQIDFITAPEAEIKNTTPVLMQTFYWEMAKGKYAKNYSEEKNLWKLLADRADKLSSRGVTAFWMPPANKAWGGMGGKKAKDSVGYSAYDLWDLGEFDQKGSVRTKYGTKEELEKALAAIHEADIDAYYDAVLNHRSGADEVESVKLSSNSPNLPGKEIQAWTKFDLAGRQQYYSKADEWQWNWHVFDGVDYADEREKEGKFLFTDKSWDHTYDEDYLLGADVDYQNPRVSHEIKEWGQWIVNDINFDGFRLDAVKHIGTRFIDDWISTVQEKTEKDVFVVGEVYNEQEAALVNYLKQVNNPDVKLFDFALRGAFANLRDGILDMRKLADVGLVNHPDYGDRAVTFIDNHDTARDSGGYTQAITTRKFQAYTYILMHEHGVPTIYWKDYYQNGMQEGLNKLLAVRQRFAHGPGRVAESTDQDTFVYLREGSSEVENSGLVSLITKKDATGTAEEPIKVTFSYEPKKEVDSVTLVGPFNGWDKKTTSLKDEDGDGVYTVEKRLAPGKYPYKFFVNGENWVKPPEAAKYKADGYGGENGIKVVEQEKKNEESSGSKVIAKQVKTDKPNTTFIDYTGNVAGTIKTDAQGKAQFKVKASAKTGWSVWVPVN